MDEFADVRQAAYAEKTEAVLQCPLIDALQASDSVIERLHHQIARLAERLQPLVQPEQDGMATLTETVPSKPKSEIVHRIETQSRSVDSGADRIAHLLALLDI